MQALFERFCANHPLQRMQIDGHCWEYIDVGSGDLPFVMLPGGFGVAATSFQYLAALAGMRRIIALHYPAGIGDIETLCNGLSTLFAHLGIARVSLLGGSASGFIAQVFVRRHPAQVAVLILAQSGAPRPERARLSLALAEILTRLPAPAILAILRLAVHYFLPGEQTGRIFWRRHFSDVVASQSREALVNRFQLAANFDLGYQFSPTDLAYWNGAIAIIESAGDRLVGQHERNALRALYPGATIYRMPGGHNDSVEAPAGQIELLATILQGRAS